MKDERAAPRGRGTAQNPTNRFERIAYVRDAEAADAAPDENPAPVTEFLKDHTRTIIATNDSPDVGFRTSINPYRGCEHGCIYCYARPTHEYLGFSAGLDFESRILVKEDAPALLRRELASPRWTPQVLAISGVTDPYQPVERKLQLTRRCLRVLADFRNPVAIITKNHLVTRDIDILAELASCQAAAVFLSITTLDAALGRVMEPRTSPPARRLAAVRALAQVGVPTGVLVAPVVPGLTDHEIPAIVHAAAEAGARSAGYGLLRLPLGVADLFGRWLEEHFPEKKKKVLNRIRALHAGRLSDSRFGARMEGEGRIADLIADLFQASCRKAGIDHRSPELSTAAFRRPGAQQLSLFG